MSSRPATNVFTAATSTGAFVKMPSELNVMTLMSARVCASVERSRKTARHGWEKRASQSKVIKPCMSHIACTLHQLRAAKQREDLGVSNRTDTQHADAQKGAHTA